MSDGGVMSGEGMGVKGQHNETKTRETTAIVFLNGIRYRWFGFWLFEFKSTFIFLNPGPMGEVKYSIDVLL